MNIRYLKTLIAVAEHGSFVAAANAVGLSPSAVSMQISALEQYLNVALFDRTHRPPILNEKGLGLLSTARQMISLHDTMRDAVAPPAQYSGRLRLGVIPTSLSSFVPGVLAEVNAIHPQIEIDIVTAMSAPLLKLLRTAEIDAGIIGEPPAILAGLQWRPFAQEPICVIAPPHADGTTAEQLLSAHPFIMLVRGALQQRMIEDYVAKNGIVLRTIMQLDSIEAVTLMVQHGLGVSIVPQRCVEPLLRLPIKRIPLGKPPFIRTLGLVQVQGSPKQHLADAVYDQLIRIARPEMRLTA